MNKKKSNLIIGLLLTSGFVLSIVFSTNAFGQNNAKVFGQGINSNFNLSFNDSSNKIPIGNGQAVIRTKNNNNITFSYSGILNGGEWRALSYGGFFANSNPINGLKSLYINYSSSNSNKLSISYGWDEEMYYQESITSEQTYYFNSQFPSYFRIDNLTGNQVDINSIIIEYSCSSTVKPDPADGYICSISEHKYNIDIHSLTLSNIHAAYNYAIGLSDNQLDDIDEISINLPSGNLYLDNTLSFSGERNNYTPITISGNNTVIYGGHELSKGIWSLHSNGIYRASIGKNISKFSSLIVNDESQTLAKTSNYSFTYSYSNRKMSIKKNTLNLSSVSGSCELVTLENWAQNIGVVTSISSSGSFTITHTLNFDENGNNIFYDRTPSYRPNTTTSISGYLQDNIAFLDEAGEWYYDKDEGYLYYMPSNSSTINTDTFVISSVETVLDTEGIVDNVTFNNIQFSGSNFSSPLTNGFAETQTSWYYDSSLNQDKTISGMVHINSVGTEFTNCVFKNASNASIYIDTQSVDAVIANSQIINSGAGGVIVGHPAKAYAGDIPENTTIRNNNIDNYGLLYQGGPGICAYYADRLTINGNNISNGAYSGISVGWGWLYSQNSYGHNRYRILNNRISNVMNNAFHDGGGIYTLGSFPNSSSEIYNEISGNYVEVNYQLNGGIYLDEGSSSWDVHENIINVINQGSTYHGVIMMHDPIDTLGGTNNSQFANHISNNYYVGDMDGSENQMQLTYENSSGTYYTGSTLSNYNNSRNIVFNTPIEESGSHVNDSIYNLSGISEEQSYSFKNEDRFSKMISGYTNLVLDSSSNIATFDVTTNGFIITSDYISDFINKGYYTMSLTINATSLNSTTAKYAVFFTSGSLSYQVFTYQTALANDLVIPLNKFNVSGATCKVQIRDANGVSLDNNLPARVTISNLKLSKFPPLTTTAYDDAQLVSSYNNEFVYQINNISYDWKRILFDGMDVAINRGFPRVRINIEGNNHNLYVFKTNGEEIDYNNQILVGGGSVTIELEDTNRSIAIMTSHENYNVSGGQDNSGIYGTKENLRVSFKFISTNHEDVLFSRKTVSKYFSGLTIHSVSNNTATISFTQSRMKLSHSLIEELINYGVSYIEFDIVVPNNSDVKSIVTCWFGGPNNTDVTYSDEGTFFKNENNIIHAVYYANRFNQAYDIELVSRDINGYSGNDINLTNAVIKNFVFHY